MIIYFNINTGYRGFKELELTKSDSLLLSFTFLEVSEVNLKNIRLSDET
jgi:hypothetical protein